jgi:glucan phosphorylase
LNDTHPAISTIELLRILIDEEKLQFEDAFKIV